MNLDKTYDASRYEADIYRRWEESGAFKPDMNAPRDPFTIIMPPPNANGNLHTGHAMYVVEDIMVRYRRMRGHKTLWLPGADHAGIETQVVYERLLEKEGKSRFDLGRDEFYRQVDDFTKRNMGNMIEQVKSLGFSVDWSRLKYTLDPDIVAVVYDTFRRLHDDGYIYRGNRIVNWCPFCHSAFADIEIKYREQADPLYYIKYGPFVVATVRPETKFGDTAIAVHPDDERYHQWVGQQIEIEDVNGPMTLPVIADRFVNPEFGTGAVKVTPAHDPNDWEMGLRHHLPVKQVIGTDGRLTELAGRYAGTGADEARAQVAHDLEERGLMDHIDMNYTHSVSYHDRCGTVIEPLMVEQWWLRVDELKKPVIEAIKDGRVKFVPKRFTKIALDWMANLRDWNISRQNWWGIRIPVYYNATGNDLLPAYVIGTEDDARHTYGEGGYEAETDNFDTWFSSGQWPFATLMATGDFDRGFYPTSVMETGRDILFLWVTRMIMFGLYRTGDVPFRTVYLHGLVTDAHGRKMSKSKGNVLNPLELTGKYGTDALRLALTIGITPGNDGPLSEQKIEGYRNFCNKLWNVARYIIGSLPADYVPAKPQLHSPADDWIAAKLDNTVVDITRAIESYRFSEAGQLLYSLLWDDFADWYLEASKVQSNPDLLVYGLTTILGLAHPFAPFVTEAIWSHLPGSEGQLITTPWPTANKKRTIPAQFEQLRQAVLAIRSLAADEQIARPVILTTDESLLHLDKYLHALAKVSEIKLVKQGGGLYFGVSGAWVEATPEQVLARRQRLQAEHQAKNQYLKSLETKLANPKFTAHARPDVVEDTRSRQAETQRQLAQLEDQINLLD